MSENGKVTITEALAEIKTIKSRLGKQADLIRENVLINVKMVDPYAKEGGTKQVIAREMQSYYDKTERIVQLRTAIARANAENTLTVAGRTRTIEEWLVWRREAASYLEALYTQIDQRISPTRGGSIVRNAVGNIVTQGGQVEVAVTVEEADLRERMDKLTTILGTLDGLLSLSNATITVTVE